MKFDFCIGNPPYQEETENEKDRANPVYDKFMDAAYQISDCVELIHPARFLFNAGQTSKAWNNKMLNDEHLKVLSYEPDASKVFSNTEIKGGVAITLHNNKKTYEIIGTFTKFPELKTIMAKVFVSPSVRNLSEIVSPRGTYRVTDEFFEVFPFAKKRLGKGTGNMIASNFFEKIPEVWIKASKDTEKYIGFLCRINNQRTYCYIQKEYIKDNEFLGGYNVISPKSNGNGEFGEVLTATELIKPMYGATDTFINIGSFDTLYEAESLTKYIKCKFFRAMLGIRKVTQDNSRDVWGMIPLQDFTDKSDIDWSKSIHEIDLQLYKKYNLSQEEIDFIESHVKEMD